VKIPVDKLWLNNMNKEVRMNFNTEDKGCGKLFAAVPARISENGKAVLSARYLKKDESGAPAESEEQMFRRVAREVAKADAAYGGACDCAEEEFYSAMAQLEFLPNSPTLMNAGCELGQLSACFVLPVEDSLESIFEAVKNTALIHKSGGGTGFSFSRIRPRGSGVRTTQGVSSGPVSFMRVFDAATDAVKQGGVRRGANMGVLRADHPDILEFIRVKSSGIDLKNFNISVAVNKAFMQAVKEKTGYPVVDPVTGKPAGSLDAAEVFHAICGSAWECGDPGLIFLDRVNQDNPTPGLGEFETTNPCGEQPLLPYESCNLGSINLGRMTDSGIGRARLDYVRLGRAVRMGVHFLDNVIDINRYPLPQIAAITLGNRKIGLGVMGWADMLTTLGIPYDSEQATVLAEEIMSFIQRAGREASSELARLRGPYPNFAKSRDTSKKDRRLQRNATVTTIAPTGTISMIAGCSSGIEPLFALSYVRKEVLDGKEMQEVHAGLVKELSERGLLLPGILDEIRISGSVKGVGGIPADMTRIYRTALDIAPEWHVRMQAAFQKHSDNGVSKTVNLPFEATVEDVAAVYQMAGDLGCKGITVYRDRCRSSQVLNVGCIACA
jgi:ribonucleoside-diphosphate reductase alpha chain